MDKAGVDDVGAEEIQEDTYLLVKMLSQLATVSCFIMRRTGIP